MIGGIDGTDNSMKQDIKSLFYQGQADPDDLPSSAKKQAQGTLNPFDLQNQMISP